MTEKAKQPNGLALLMLPFEPHEVGKLPKPTKAQTDEVKANFKAGVRCDICGAWHHPKVVHLDYVGHAALTKRLLQVDPRWSWEPMALTPQGAPLVDQHGGLWIRLTVCGMTRIGYGHADGKTGGDAIKEAVGDALRNSALRFGAALDLWHKGDLYDADELKEMGAETSPPPPAVNPRTSVAPHPAANTSAPPSAKKPSPADWTAAYIAGLAPVDSMDALRDYTAERSAALVRLDKVAPDLRDRIELAIAEKRHSLELAENNPFKE